MEKDTAGKVLKEKGMDPRKFEKRKIYGIRICEFRSLEGKRGEKLYGHLE